MNTLNTVQDLLVKEFELAPEKVHAEARIQDLGIDSLATIEFMFLLEEKFGLKMPEAPETVGTVGDIAKAIDFLLIEGGGAAVQA